MPQSQNKNINAARLKIAFHWMMISNKWMLLNCESIFNVVQTNKCEWYVGESQIDLYVYCILHSIEQYTGINFHMFSSIRTLLNERAKNKKCTHNAICKCSTSTACMCVAVRYIHRLRILQSTSTDRPISDEQKMLNNIQAICATCMTE